MNTYQRHQVLVLRRQRTRILRRRALKASCASAALFIAWSVFAAYSPRSIAPPPPGIVGQAAAVQLVSTASTTLNSLHSTLYPAHRDSLKARALRSFALASDVESREEALPMLPDYAIAEHTPPQGRQLRILLIGIDARLGNARGRADALHLVSISADDGTVDILSVPRGTPSPLGYKNPGSNIISSVRSARGRDELIRRVARLCRVDSIPYFVELGFSDALGILELLGYQEPLVELQALRSRHGFQYGDHNRSYNQGVFIKKALLRLLPLLDGPTGTLLMDAGLAMVASNLDIDLCSGIVALLNDVELAEHPSLVRVDVRSPYSRRIRNNADAVPGSQSIAGIDYRRFKQGRGDAALKVIRRALSRSRSPDVTPGEQRAVLLPIYRQHGWLQIREMQLRRSIRDSLLTQLREACVQTDDRATVREIETTIAADDLLFGAI